MLLGNQSYDIDLKYRKKKKELFNRNNLQNTCVDASLLIQAPVT